MNTMNGSIGHAEFEKAQKELEALQEAATAYPEMTDLIETAQSQAEDIESNIADGVTEETEVLVEEFCKSIIGLRKELDVLKASKEK